MVEHALQTGGDDYLGTQEHRYTWWQLTMLDVQLCLLSAVGAALFLVGTALWYFIRFILSNAKAEQPLQKRKGS